MLVNNSNTTHRYEAYDFMMEHFPLWEWVFLQTDRQTDRQTVLTRKLIVSK